MLKNLKKYFQLLRVRDWRGYLLIGLFGFFISKGFLFPLENIILFWIVGFLLLGFGFSINECFDTKEDKHNLSKENPLVSKKTNFKKSLFFSILAFILALVFSTFFGLKIFLFSLGAGLLGLFYSAPPLRFKAKPFLDLISHGLFAGSLIFIFPLLVFKSDLNLFHYLISFSVFYLSIILELRNHLEDFASDKIAGLKTTVCFLGWERSEKLLRYLAIFYPLILLPVFLLVSWPYWLFFLIFSLIFLFCFLRSKNYPLIKNYRLLDFYSGFSFSLLAIKIMFG